MTARVAYLLHFFDPATGLPARYRHAGHYLGDTDAGREEGRLQEHRDGQGAKVTAAARRAGLDFTITRTWPGGAWKARQLKSRSGASYCPVCNEHPLPGIRPRRPGARYLTRRQREAATRQREARQAIPAPGWPWPGKPLPPCPGCERQGAHTTECDERERVVARFLQDIGAEPREEPEEMFGRRARAAARGEARQQAEAGAEADRLYAELDRLEDQAPNYLREITAERAARIRNQLAEPLTRDAGAPEPGCGPVLQGAELDAEIDRLAAMVPDLDACPAEVAAWEEASWALGERERARDAAAAQDRWLNNQPGEWETGWEGEVEAPGPEPGADAATWSPALAGAEPDGAPDGNLAETLAPTRQYEAELAQLHLPQTRAEEVADKQAAGWYDNVDAGRPDHQLLSEYADRTQAAWRRERAATAAEHLAALAHDEQALSQARQEAGRAREARRSATRGAYAAAADMQRSAPAPEPGDPGTRSPLPRLLETSPATLAPVAATLPDGTPHASRFLAGRGWQTQDGVYVRQPQPQAEAV